MGELYDMSIKLFKKSMIMEWRNEQKIQAIFSSTFLCLDS